MRRRGFAGTECAPDEHLRGDRDRVEHERGEHVQPHRDLMGRQRRLGDAGEDRARCGEREQQPRERTNSSPEIRTSGATRCGRGARERAGARNSSQANAAPIALWATNVPAADPSSPQSSP